MMFDFSKYLIKDLVVGFDVTDGDDQTVTIIGLRKEKYEIDILTIAFGKESVELYREACKYGIPDEIDNFIYDTRNKQTVL
mgnify:CR=1 FL=1